MRDRIKITMMISCVFCAAMVLLCPMRVEAAMSQAEKSAYEAVFDADYYYNQYADIAKVIGKNKNDLFEHFVIYGIVEGRNGNAEFNPMSYRYRYADLDAAFGNDMAAYCSHYVNYGKAEGRDGSAGAYTAPQVISVIGTYSTAYNARIARAKNVELAARRINGVTLQPGESFSYSQTILPRTTENGYVEAPIIVNKEYTSGIGGGVCQVSSTLYAAMVTAGLPATERHPHSLPVTYLPVGMDATISGTKLDLKFDNIYEQPLMIRTVANKGTLTVSLMLLSE